MICPASARHSVPASIVAPQVAVSLPALPPVSWSAMEGGLNHTCAISDGTVWCWATTRAANSVDGSQVSTGRPVPSAVTQVVAGRLHSCAPDTGHALALYCWGNNAYGQVGDGTTTQRPLPVPVTGGVVCTSLAAGDWHTRGVRLDGSLWCWGQNAFGQLGDGTSTNRSTPNRIGTDTNWATVRAGGWHTCATRTNGTMWCWGRNQFGQLGDGTTSSVHEAGR